MSAQSLAQKVEEVRQEVLKTFPGAYSYATSRQIWIQNAKGTCISQAMSFSSYGPIAELMAWRSVLSIIRGKMN